MCKMLKTHRNAIGNLMITLLFVGGCIFLLTGSWDASEAEAVKGCCGGKTTTTGCDACGGGMDAAPLSSSSNCNNDCTVDGKAANCEESDCSFSCNGTVSPHNLPTSGQTPNSTQERRKVCSNDLHQSRSYDANGDASEDTDYGHSHGEHGPGHTHQWINGDRQDP